MTDDQKRDVKNTFESTWSITTSKICGTISNDMRSLLIGRLNGLLDMAYLCDVIDKSEFDQKSNLLQNMSNLGDE